MKYLFLSFILTCSFAHANNLSIGNDIKIHYTFEDDRGDDKKLKKEKKKNKALKNREKKKYLKSRKKNVTKNSSRFNAGPYKNRKNYNI